MEATPQQGDGGFPEPVRSAVAQTYDTVYAAIKANDWTAGVEAAQTVLALLVPFPLTTQVPAPVWVEKAWSLYVLGMAARERGDLNETVRYMQQAASVAPSPDAASYFPNRQARSQLGVALVKLGRFGAAREELQRALAYNPPQAERAELLFWRGMAWDLEGDSDRATLAYESALHVQAGLRADDQAVVPAWTGAAVKRLASGDRIRAGHSTREDAPRPAAARGFWTPWLAVGPVGIAALAGLIVLSVVCWCLAAFELRHAPPYEGIPWWLALLAFPLLLLLQPSLTRFSIAGPLGSLIMEQPPASTPSSQPPDPSNIDNINIILGS